MFVFRCRGQMRSRRRGALRRYTEVTHPPCSPPCRGAPRLASMADLKAPRGMHDLLPEDEALWRIVRDTGERVARLFDYRLISTPIVEDSGVFLRTVGDESDIVDKEMYVF